MDILCSLTTISIMKTFEKVVTLWKAEKRQWVKDATYAVYVQHLNNHIIPYFKSRIGKPTLEQAKDFAKQLSAKSLSPKSIRDITTVLRMILRYGERLGAWGRVDLDLHMPDEGPKKPAVLAQRDQRKLIEHLRANPDCRGLGVLISMHTGLRIGEICGLQWRDIDVRAGVLRVRQTVQRIYLADGPHRSYYLSIGTPKTATSVREIPLAGELLRLIRPLRRTTTPDYYVVSNSPDPLEPRAYRAYFRRLLTQLGIHPIRFHALRHTFATRCIESRCDYKTVSSILGHASISTTLDLYVHPGLNAKKRVIEKMAKRLK